MNDIMDRIKADLPSMPHHVIKDWLVPLATGPDSYGWPPDFNAHGKWRHALMAKSLGYWKQSTWKSEMAALQLEDFTFPAQDCVIKIAGEHVAGEQNIYSQIENSTKPFFRICAYLVKHGTLPVPPIVRLDTDGLTPIDGKHRIAALVYVREMWSRDDQRPAMKVKGCLQPLPLHSTGIMTPPAEGDYETEPASALSGKVAFDGESDD